MRVGFVGLGTMGAPMAGTLTQAGHEVMVLDADLDRSARFAAEHGARVAAGPADLAVNEIVITMLPDGLVVREVLLHSDGGGFINAVQPGTVVVDMSSSDPLGTIELGKELSKRGVSLIDSAVAKRDTVFNSEGGNLYVSKTPLALVLMVGCDDRQALDRARPLLELLGDTIFETGSLGSGHATKTLNNYASAAAQVVLGEVLLVGTKFGLDPKTLIDVINVSTGRSFNSQFVYKYAVRNEDFVTGFAIRLMAKDVKIATDLASAMHVDAPVARLVEERWALASRELPTGDVVQARRAWGATAPK